MGKVTKNKTFRITIGIIINILCVVFIYVSGIYAPSTYKENISIEISNLASNDYLNVYQKEKKGLKYFDNLNIDKTMQQVIKENNASHSYNMFQCALTYGIHDGNIRIPDLNFGNNSVFLVSNIFSNHVNSNKQIIMDAYYLELMFKDENVNYSSYDNFCYITQDQADYLIKNNDDYSNYRSLINKTLEVNIDDNIYRWKIANIIVPFGEYYDGLLKVFNDFLLCYMKLPSYQYYSISHFYSNDYKVTYFQLDETKKKYSDSNLQFDIYNCDLYDLETTTEINHFFNNEISYNYIGFVTCFLIAILFVILFFAYLIIFRNNTVSMVSISFIPPFVIYMFLFVCFRFSSDVVFLSFFSNMFFLIFMFALIALVSYLYFKRGKQGV